MNIILEHIEDGVTIPHRTYLKTHAEFSDEDNELIQLDMNLQLILIDSLDRVMYNNVVNCTSAKQIWDTLQIINEGSEEVRENKKEILVAQYEQFGSNPGEGISEVFIRFNNLINNLNLNGKYYDNKEVQMKQRYGWGKTINASTSVSNSTALVIESPVVKERKVVVHSKSTQEYVVPEIGHTSTNTGDDEFYSMEELDQLEDESRAMFARKFSNMRFMKNPSYKFKSYGSEFQKGESSSTTSKGAYKTGMVDRRKFKCFNCDEPDSDEEEERGNVALMAFMEPSTPPHRTGGFPVDPTCPKLLMQLGLDRDDALKKLKALTLEHKALKLEVHELKLKEKLVLTPKIEQLTSDLLTQSNKVKVLEYRENKLNEQLAEEKVRCLAYKESTNIVKNLVDQKVIKRKVGIGFYYNKSVGKASNITPFVKSAEDRENIENEREILASVEPMQVGGTFSSSKAGIGANGLKNNFNKPNKFVKCRNGNNTCSSTNNIRTSENVNVETIKPPVVLNNMPTVPLVDMCHRPCGVDNCMLCAFNVMSSYFKTGPSPIKKDTYVPKPKPKVFKAVCRKVSTVKADADVIRT
ncbi:uncharacterized protein LOC135150507 [Daucus carota subsp. sativus]|uniref:uncharacterized protein LOC135150507 n=1 Tax=Daucus carota subsp. sativus TaxID=79200 RepID=UPI0030839C66